jgi:arsenate reductase-like glutaredoxin family protein
MTKFIPPISKRETEELIEIANCVDEDIWQREATIQAKKELIKRNISQDEQNKVIRKWEKEVEKYFKEEGERLEKNKTESYATWELIVLFLFGPFLIVRPFIFNSHTIFTLRSENYYLKFKQRIGIFILSFLAWYFYINYSFEQSEKKDWKK